MNPPQPVRRRGSWLWPLTAIVGWSLLVLTLAAGGWLLWSGKLALVRPPKPAEATLAYEASMDFYIEPVVPGLLDARVNPRDGEPFLVSFHRVQGAILRSRLVLNAALKKPGVSDLTILKKQDDPVEWLQRNLRVAFPHGPEFMRLSLAGDDPEELRKVVSAVTEAYMEEVVTKEHRKRLERIDKLRDLARRYEERVAQKRRTINEMVRQAGMSTNKPELIEFQLKAKLDLKALAEKEYAQLHADKRKHQREIAALDAEEKSLTNDPIPGDLIEEALAKDLRMRELLDQEAKVSVMIKIAPPAENKDQRARLQAIQKALEEFRQELRPRIEQQLRDKQLYELKQRREELKSWLASWVQFTKELEEEIQRLEKLTQDITAKTADLDSLLEEKTMDEGVVKQARAEAEQMEVERLSPPRVRLLEDDVIVVPLK